MHIFGQIIGALSTILGVLYMISTLILIPHLQYISVLTVSKKRFLVLIQILFWCTMIYNLMMIHWIIGTVSSVPIENMLTPIFDMGYNLVEMIIMGTLFVFNIYLYKRTKYLKQKRNKYKGSNNVR